MKTPTITECSAALQGLSGAERAIQDLVKGTRWENDPRMERFWLAAGGIVDVLNEAHREAVAQAQSLRDES